MIIIYYSEVIYNVTIMSHLVTTAIFAAFLHYAKQCIETGPDDTYINHLIMISQDANAAMEEDNAAQETRDSVLPAAFLLDIASGNMDIAKVEKDFGVGVAAVIREINMYRYHCEGTCHQSQLKNASKLSLATSYLKLAELMSNYDAVMMDNKKNLSSIKSYRLKTHAVVHAIYESHPDKFK